MTFQPVPGVRAVSDDESGMIVRVRQTGADISAMMVSIGGVMPTEMQFSIRLEPQNAECSCIIETYSIEMMLKYSGMTNFDENSRLVHQMIEGVQEFNRHWPLLPSARFCSDITLAEAKGVKLSFAMPNDDYFAGSTN